jgi:RNA polymerase sigma factor (sigma-70 family)
MLAASAGRRDNCSLLLAEGADVSQRSPGGLTAADLALAAGHSSLAMMLAPQLVSVVACLEADTIPFASDEMAFADWEAEEETKVSRSQPELLAVVRTSQVQLGRTLPDAAPDWSDIELTLPMRPSARPLSPALSRWLSEALRGLVVPAEIQRISRRLPGLTAVLEDAGVRTVGEPLENFIDACLNVRSQHSLDADLQTDMTEVVERLLDPCDSDRIRRIEIDRLPSLSRATEQSMFRALGDARRGVLRALLASASLIEPDLTGEEAVAEEADDEAEIDADFSSILLKLRDLGREDALERLGQLDLDVGLTERVIARLDRMENGSGPALRLQLKRYLTARDRIVTAGLPWVEPCARRHLQHGMELGDLWQEGAIGLMRAAERFNPALGYRFQTFAIWWIRQGCSRGRADQAHTIRVPVHVQDARVRFRRAEAELKAEGSVSPDFAQIADRAELTLDRARLCLRPRRQLSLSRPGLERWAVRLPCSDREQPLVNLHMADRRRHLASAVAALPEREADIVRRRFGLDGYEATTLEEVGQHYNLTRERIRQIETKALNRLRRSPDRNILRVLL